MKTIGDTLRILRHSLTVWLLIFACEALPQLPAAALPAASNSPDGLHFRDVSKESGLTTAPSTVTDRRYVIDMMSGGGVALFDCDDDGRLDIAVVNDSSIERYLAGGVPMVTLYRQDGKDGALHFTDVTASSGLNTKGWATGLAVADFDNDGQADLFVTG